MRRRARAPGAPPNILLLFTDQQRHDTIGALGNPYIRTPALDRLAREGTSFLRCYSPCPVCVPARTALFTGLPPHVTGCVDNGSRACAAPSFVERLAAAGYQTHGVGKMHFTPDWRRPWGFASRDTSEEVQEGHDYRRFVESAGFGHVLELGGPRGEYYYLPQPSQLPERLHETRWVGDRSVDFLRRRDRGRPFFLMASFIKPHPPFENPVPWHRLYRCTDLPAPHVPADCHDYWTRINRVQNRYKYMDQVGQNDRLLRTIKSAYYGAISFIDAQVGRILHALRNTGELDDTLVIFSSDHGELLGDYLCFGKRCLLESSMRVPLLVRFPRAFSPGTRCRTPVSLLDLHPTFITAAGIAGPSLHAEARPLQDTVRHPRQPRLVFSQFQHGWMGHYAATDGRWKYMRSTPDRREWLFEVDDRGLEGRNLAGRPAGRDARDRLLAALRERYAGSGPASPFAGSAWRNYPVPPFSRDPDYGLIRQDESRMPARLRALGPYSPPRRRDLGKAERILVDHMA